MEAKAGLEATPAIGEHLTGQLTAVGERLTEQLTVVGDQPDTGDLRGVEPEEPGDLEQAGEHRREEVWVEQAGLEAQEEKAPGEQGGVVERAG